MALKVPSFPESLYSKEDTPMDSHRHRGSHYRMTNMLLQSIFAFKGDIRHIEFDHATGVINIYTDDGDIDLTEGQTIQAQAPKLRKGWKFFSDDGGKEREIEI